MSRNKPARLEVEPNLQGQNLLQCDAFLSVLCELRPVGGNRLVVAYKAPGERFRLETTKIIQTHKRLQRMLILIGQCTTCANVWCKIQAHKRLQ